MYRVVAAPVPGSSTSGGLILASASPRRRELLARVGLSFVVAPSAIPEDELPGESPEEHVLRLSRAKAAEVARRADLPGRWVLGSDTIVVCDRRLLGKPRDAREAGSMLRALSGRRHEVVSGFAVRDRHTGACKAAAVTTGVRFRPLTDAEIAAYVASGEPLDKAGAYAIQGLGAALVEAIEGSYTSVVGLPLCEVLAVLRELGAIETVAEP